MGNLCARTNPHEDQNGQSPRNVLNPRLLNRKERKIVKKTWKELGLENQQEFIRDVWLTSAKRSPKVKQILGLDEQAAQETERFKKLNRDVHLFFDHLIVDLNLEAEEILEASYIMGLRHSEYGQNDFQPVFWDIFLVSLVESMEKQELKGNEESRWFVIYSWHKFAHFIVNQMLQGYRAARIGIKEDLLLG